MNKPSDPTNPNERARELKPCPFCGGKATISLKGNAHSTRSVVVKCSWCRYERKDSALRYGHDWLLDAAVTAWNRRALSHAAAVEGGWPDPDVDNGPGNAYRGGE